MKRTRLQQFIDKYDFPAHLFVAFDIIVGYASTFFWTLRTKMLLRILGLQSAHSGCGRIVGIAHAENDLKFRTLLFAMAP